MSYTNIWDDSAPTGSEAANTLAAIIRGVKLDIDQRFSDIFAIPDFAADPLRPYGLKFTDADDSKIFLGDNSGTPRNLLIRNKADDTTYGEFNSSGFTGNVVGNVTGNADTATKLATSRNIFGQAFDGSADITGSGTFAAGTVTASTPLTITQTWNNSGITFTGIFANFTNTASASDSLMMDLQLGGASKVTIDLNGNLKVPALKTSSGSVSAPDSAAVTLFDVSNGVYLVHASLNARSDLYSASAIISCSDGSNAILNLDGSAPSMIISVSGAHVKASQGSGSAQTIKYSYTKFID